MTFLGPLVVSVHYDKATLVPVVLAVRIKKRNNLRKLPESNVVVIQKYLYAMSEHFAAQGSKVMFS